MNIEIEGTFLRTAEKVDKGSSCCRKQLHPVIVYKQNIF